MEHFHYLKKKKSLLTIGARESCSFTTHCGLIVQVVLPMPGNSVKYPENEVGSWYQERLAQDGLRTCRFRIPSLKLNVPGCYRPLLSYPRNVSYSLHKDKDTQDTGLSAPLSRTRLALSFNLNASCYATVCLREIMKCEL